MNITETIRNKKAMLDAVGYVVQDLENCKEYPKNQIQRLTDYIKGYKDVNPDWKADDWEIKSNTEEIEGYKATIAAYEAIQKALEKLI